MTTVLIVVLAALAGSVALRLYEHRADAVAWADRRWTARYHRPVIRHSHRPKHRHIAGRDTPRTPIAREAAA